VFSQQFFSGDEPYRQTVPLPAGRFVPKKDVRKTRLSKCIFKKPPAMPGRSEANLMKNRVFFLLVNGVFYIAKEIISEKDFKNKIWRR